jgi:Holliday junction resolvasome RuvABC endonuclease subunit
MRAMFSGYSLLERERNHLGFVFDQILDIVAKMPYEQRLKDLRYKLLHQQADEIIKRIKSYEQPTVNSVYL